MSFFFFIGNKSRHGGVVTMMVVLFCSMGILVDLAHSLASPSPSSQSDTFSSSSGRLTAPSELSRRSWISNHVVATSMVALTTAYAPTTAAWARLESVNRPDLLPKEAGLNVIQTEKFLTAGQAKRLNDLLTNLERDTGFRVRVLCQKYPNTPGLAIRDYWSLAKEGQKDDKYVVLVVDEFGGKGNVLNFNVGEGVKFALPNVFWTRLASKYGTIFYVRDNGIDLSIVNAIEAITTCLRSEDGYCVDVPSEGVSMKSLGF